MIKDNEAVYLLNEQTYLHLRENLQGVGYEVFDKNSPLPVEEGQIPREALGNTQRRIENLGAAEILPAAEVLPGLAPGGTAHLADELEKLARENPGDELYLAIGSDMLLSFDGWHRWEDILRLAHLVVTSRNIGDDPALHAKARQLDASGARILFAPVEALPMASSVLRTRLAAGEECENELPASVRRVIRREGLYTKGDEVTNESETGKRACAQPAE